MSACVVRKRLLPHKTPFWKSREVDLKCSWRVRKQYSRGWCDLAVEGSQRDWEYFTGCATTWHPLGPSSRWSGYPFNFVRRLWIRPRPMRPTRAASMSDAALGSGTIAAENDTGLSGPAPVS